VDGFVFKTSTSGTGYHRDVMQGAPKVVICLDALTSQEYRQHDYLYDKRPARHARHLGGLRIRRKPRVPASDADIASLDAIACGHTEFSSTGWKELGLWALDTVNGNSWDTVVAKVLPRSSADILFVQEAKAVGEHGVAKVRSTGRKAGWNCDASPALRLADAFGSGGCAVAASGGVGITSQPDWTIRDGFQHRFKLAWVGAILKGGIHMGSLYLRDSVGLSEENLCILQEVAIVLKKLRGPWIVAGDFNLNPDLLRSSGWLDIINGVLVAPTSPTCHGSTYDYFIVCQALAPSVAGIARIDDGGMHPHSPSRLFLKGDGRRKLVRRLSRPAKVPGVLPEGPLPCPRPASESMPVEVSQDAIDGATDRWVEAACREWSSLLGYTVAPKIPTLSWRPAVTGPTSQFLGASSMSTFWRIAAGRLDESAAILDRARPGGFWLLSRHFAKLRADIKPNVWDPADVTVASAFIDAAIVCANAGDTPGLRKLAASARRNAKKLEDSVSNMKASEWRHALSVPVAGRQASSRPSKLAFAWVRGLAGWTRSPVGTQQQEDVVPCDDLEQHDQHDLLIDAPYNDRMWAKNSDDTPMVLSNQADVEREADGWATLWDESAEYELRCDPPP